MKLRKLSGEPVRTENAIWQFPFRNLEEVIAKVESLFFARRPKVAESV